MKQLTRREFLAAVGAGLGTAAVSHAGAARQAADATGRLAFFLIGDTHYLANRDRPGELDAASRAVTTRLVDWLNRLPGSAIPEAAGGGTVATPRGVIHAGDVIDSGDKRGSTFEAMQPTEWRAFEADFGLTGKDGRLKYPVYEVHGNHDSPRGDGLAVEAIKRRNKQRPGLADVSPGGLHYSWDWGPVHFVNLGIVVGAVPEVVRRRRYSPLDSLPFLRDDLKRHAGDRKRPVVLTHHVDVARYSDEPDPAAEYRNQEWDPSDVRGYYDTIKGYNVVGVLYGHTHVRNVFRWDGTRSLKAREGIPVFNTDNVSHFQSQTQALMYGEVTDREFLVREFATKDAWQTGEWTPAQWRVPLSRP
jgi:cytolysin (calcineurin-like family phosphatase)